MGSVNGGGGAGGARLQVTPAFIQRTTDIFRPGQRVTNQQLRDTLVAMGSNGAPPLTSKERLERYKVGETYTKFTNDFKEAVMKHQNDAYQFSYRVGPNGERVAWKTHPSKNDLREFSSKYSKIVSDMTKAQENGDKKGYNSGATKLSRSIEGFVAQFQGTKGQLAATAIRGLESIRSTEVRLQKYLSNKDFAKIAKMDVDGSHFAKAYARIAKDASKIKGRGKWNAVKNANKLGELAKSRLDANISNVVKAMEYTKTTASKIGVTLDYDKKGNVKSALNRKSIGLIAKNIKESIGIIVNQKNIRTKAADAMRRGDKVAIGE